MAHKAVILEVADFVNTFISLPPGLSLEDRPKWSSDIFTNLADGDNLSESDVADRLFAAINNSNIVPGLKMAQLTDKPEIDDVNDLGQEVDAAFCREGDVPTDGQSRWVDQLISVEIKRYAANEDPFDDCEDRNHNATSDERSKARGQIITDAEVVFRVQHRAFLFTLLVFGRNFRLFRWDRSGTIVTHAIDYVAHPDVLCEVLWRMSLQSDEQLGLDPSATRLRPHDCDYKLMDFYAQERAADLDTHERVLTAEECQTMGDQPVFKYVRSLFKHSLAPSWPRYVLEVPFKDGVRKFLVCRSIFYADGMVGRGTRGYVAFDCQTRKFVWLKDAWRVCSKQLMLEGAVLEKLNKDGVEHVPTLLCHGDIREQTTMTSDIWEQSYAAAAAAAAAAGEAVPSPHSPCSLPSTPPVAPQTSKSSRPRKRSRAAMEAEETRGKEEETVRQQRHYRMVVQEVTLPLSQFSCGRQLVSIIIDCVKAHGAAFEKSKIMHRDISGGNILIHPTVQQVGEDGQSLGVIWEGLLSDWELSKPLSIPDSLQPPCQPPRTGTWPFLSVAMLSAKPKAVELPDELESFFHVLLYYAVRYLNSNLSCCDAPGFIESYFHDYSRRAGAYTCGIVKARTVRDARLEVGWNEALKFNSPLDKVFRTLLLWLKARYEVRAYHFRQSEAAKASSLSSTSKAPPKPGASNSAKAVRPRQKSMTAREVRAMEALAAYLDEHEDDLTPKLTAQQEALAELLNQHAGLLFILSMAHGSTEDWDPNDKVGDRAPDDDEPCFPVALDKGSSTRTAKRRRTESESAILHQQRHTGDVAPHSRRPAKSVFQ
ncbi:hypothetical protein FKP32DRAFT_1590337 [Trametes sanguinea]|nr:hypothetical protein FKP32DRAFT_1590337 [Trametes sanguinea]